MCPEMRKNLKKISIFWHKLEEFGHDENLVCLPRQKSNSTYMVPWNSLIYEFSVAKPVGMLYNMIWEYGYSVIRMLKIGYILKGAHTIGLIAAGLGADQWKEFFYCDAIDKNVLVVKGQKRISGRSSNTKGNDNIISNGSVIAVADGQCMIIVEQGKIVEVCAEPGEFVWDSSTEPSIFTGKLGTSIKETFKLIGKRFTFGGDPGKDQRVYYFNTKEIIDNKFGTPTPIPFRVVDRNIHLDIDVSVCCSGLYSYRVADPLLFYANVCGNVERAYTRDQIDSQLKTEFVSALQPAFAKISEMEVRPSALPGHAEELSEAMNAALSKKWRELRGLQVVSIAMNPITLSEEDQELIKKAQHAAIMRDPTMTAATLVEAHRARP